MYTTKEMVTQTPAAHTTTSGIRIHNIQTGWVAVKTAHRQYSGIDGVRFPALLLDPYWTEWMPIHTWVIEHPEGVIIVDTGETAQVNDPAYTNCDPATHFIYRTQLRFQVQEQDELVAQLTRLGITHKDVRWVIQTHLHSDHMGNLKHFITSEIVLSPLDYPNALGTLPCQYSPDMSPTLVAFTPHEITGFERAYPVTKAGDVLIIPTPGHSAGHQSVMLIDGEVTYCFAGDATFSEAQLRNGNIGAIVKNPTQSRHSIAQLQAYCRQHATVYLPSHDAESRTRLLNTSTVQF
jgi:glyoxylase-like metal-dependent hydrolase (beta-lactamase superfamily II)